MAEGLWCLVLRTYQYKKEKLTARRRYGLPNVGDQVKGGNSESIAVPMTLRKCVTHSSSSLSMYTPNRYTMRGQAVQSVA